MGGQKSKPPTHKIPFLSSQEHVYAMRRLSNNQNVGPARTRQATISLTILHSDRVGTIEIYQQSIAIDHDRQQAPELDHHTYTWQSPRVHQESPPTTQHVSQATRHHFFCFSMDLRATLSRQVLRPLITLDHGPATPPSSRTHRAPIPPSVPVWV